MTTNADRFQRMKQILLELSSLNGDVWKEVVGEQQPHFNEMVFWILLYEDSDIHISHKAFCQKLAPHIKYMKPLEATVIYNRFYEAGLFCIAFPKGNDAVFQALAEEGFGNEANAFRNDSSMVYSTTDSKR